MKPIDMLAIEIGSKAILVDVAFAEDLGIEVGAELTRVGSGHDDYQSIYMSYVDGFGKTNHHFFTSFEIEKSL